MSHSTHALVHTNSDKYRVAASDPKALARILRKVRYEGDCWIWTGAVNQRGYAVATSSKQSVYVHRLTHWIVQGVVKDGYVLDHLCRNPSCVNPLHTEPVTSAENTKRGSGGAARSECPYGHGYDAANTRITIDRNGYPHRQCVACANRRNASRRSS